MAWLSNPLRKPVFRNCLVAGVSLVVLYTLLGFFALPAILKSFIPKTLGETLHRKTTVQDIRVNPFKLTVSVRGLEISERGAPGAWISAEEIFANLQLASVVRRGLVLSEVRLVRPYGNIVRRPDRTYNFSDLIEEFTKVRKKRVEEETTLRFSLNNIQVVDGRLNFDDGPKKTRHEVRGIHIGIPFLSNLPYHIERYVQPSFAAVVNGHAVSLKGRTKPFHESLETVFDVNVSNLDVPHYLQYVPFPREYDVPSAILDLKGSVSFVESKGKPSVVRVEGEATLREMRVVGKDKRPMLRLPLVRTVIAPTELMARDIRIASVTVKDPEVDVSIDRNGKLNLLALTLEKDKENPEGAKGEKTAGKKEAPGDGETKFSVESIRLSGGKVRFVDSSRKPAFQTSLGDIRVEVDRLGNEMGKKAEALASFSTEAGETFELKGNLSLSPLASEGTAAIGKVVLRKYAPYYAGAVRFDVNGGTLGVRSGYRYAQAEGGTQIRLTALAATLSDLRLRQREEKQDFLKIPGIVVKDADVNVDGKEIAVGEVGTGNGTVTVRRRADGELNVARLMPEKAAEPGKTPAKAPPGKSAGNAPAEKPWSITLKKAVVDRYAARFEDLTTDPPVEIALDRLQLRAGDVTTERNRKGTFSFSTVYNRTGRVSLGGGFSVEPPSLHAKVAAKALPIGPMQPYYTGKVKIVLTGGSVSVDGNVSIDAPKDRPARAQFRGEAFVNDFSSLDKARSEDFLKFASVHVGGIDVGYNPTKVSIEEISLTDFYSRIIVNPDGTLNVQGIVGNEEGARDNAAKTGTAEAKVPPAPADTAAQSPPVPVRIGTVTLQGGAVNFSDRYIKPNYSASLVEIGGRVTGLSSEESILADVDLRGKLENSAPLEIGGKINPLAKDLFLDLKVDFRDMDLSPLSPYSGRFAGYAIEKGKLSLSLKYHIEKRKLDSENKVFLDQFTFGEAVDSPDATKLPVRLAVALLKDRSGEIHLDLPVTGQIDDPKFSVWRIVWKIIGNLLVKAATSPFALLGAIFGGGEELAYLEFEPGLSAIPAAEAGKIGNLGKILFDRPALKIEIEGHVDLERDKEGLRQLTFRRKLAARKLEDLAKTGQPAPALDNVRIEAAEYPKYLARAYKGEKFPKPRNFLGMAKDLPVPEMEKLMLTHIQVTNDDLRQLAVGRASHVRDSLVAGGKVESGRIFLVEPKSLPPERKEKLSDSRVDFRIR